MDAFAEAFPARFYRSITSYWRHRKYQKLDGSASRKTVRVARLGAGGGSKRITWKVRRPVFRIRIQMLSPVRFLAKLKDAYIDAMLRLAGRGGALSDRSSGPERLLSRRVPRGRSIRPQNGDFERRLIFEIYKSLAESENPAAYAQRELLDA